MIEVELKFLLTNEEERRLLDNAVYLETQDFVDVYYDNQEYNLSTQDIWLRTRNDKFVLKLPIQTTNTSLAEQNNTPKLEIEELDNILMHLNITPAISISDDLKAHGILPRYEFRNIRKKYKKDDFVIDIDKAIFDDFIYETCEIELVVDSEEDISDATQRIENFAMEHGIKIGNVEGRLIEYIRRKNPLHYQKLLHASQQKVAIVI